MGKTNVRLSILTQLRSTMTISNTDVFNHYASTAHEPSRLKSIVKFSFQKVIFGGPFGGVTEGLELHNMWKKIVS